MAKFIVKDRKTNSKRLELEYDTDERLCKFETENEGLTDIQHEFLLKRMVSEILYIDTLQAFFQEQTIRSRFELIEYFGEPPTFDDYWNTYNYKHGKKDRVKKLWNLLSDADKILCVHSIPKYNRWLSSKPNLEQVYPETFISQRRFENDFTIR